MKKVATALITTAIFITSTFPALAEDATTSTIPRAKAAERVAQIKETTASRDAAMKSKIDTRKEEIASRTAALKAKLKTFKDKKKANLTEKINTNLNKINEKRTELLGKRLDEMSKIVSKLEARLNEAKTAGKDTSAAQAALDSAKSTWQDAKTSVDTQAQKSYTITVSDEGKIGQDAKATRDQLHNDLKETNQKVIDAKQAIAKAIETASSTLGGKSGQ